MTPERRKKLARVIATWVVTGIMISVFVLDIITVALANEYVSRLTILPYSDEKSTTADRIHFLNTANSDCIIIESNGKFALVDSGEGDNNPRRKTQYEGYGDEVLNYIKKTCANDKGYVHFDFIVATHMHYDHSGNFERIIKDKQISVGKAYIKKYTEKTFTETEAEAWGNMQIYNTIISALNSKSIPVISDIPSEVFDFGDFRIQFFNTVTPPDLADEGDNVNSIGVKLQKGEKSAFLAADFTATTGLEDIYAKEIGDVDILKIGHHGYFGSSSNSFLKTVKPDIAICTNYIGKIYPNVKWNLTMTAKVPILSTEHRNGIVTEFTDTEILIFENTM